jgi:hypothetical protein
VNPHTGHLVRLEDEAALAKLAESYERLPKELEAEATKALAGNFETHIDLRGKTPLAEWAKKKRKAKIAAKSRRINRGK